MEKKRKFKVIESSFGNVFRENVSDEKKNYLSKEEIEKIVKEIEKQFMESENEREIKKRKSVNMVAQKKLNTRKFKEIPNTPADSKFFPFWNPINVGDVIEGNCGMPRKNIGKFGEQDIIDIGEHTVNISAGLHPLYDLVNKYVRLTYLGLTTNSNTGMKFKKFKIELAEE